MKTKLIIALAALVAAFTINVNAGPTEAPATFNLLSGLPATLAGGTTTNLATPILLDCSEQRFMALQFRPIPSVPASQVGSNVLFVIAPSADGIAADTNRTITLSVPLANTAGAANIYTTNLDCGGYAAWFIMSEQNQMVSGIVTNNRNGYTTKIGWP